MKHFVQLKVSKRRTTERQKKQQLKACLVASAERRCNEPPRTVQRTLLIAIAIVFDKRNATYSVQRNSPGIGLAANINYAATY